MKKLVILFIGLFLNAQLLLGEKLGTGYSWASCDSCRKTRYASIRGGFDPEWNNWDEGFGSACQGCEEDNSELVNPV